ncbi:hypothetical protein ASE80_11575 [Pseudomonas sp. Leaf15]|uniref:dermonecrotic toxin domain-containing protein n=1 Tax=unclassified Pseudomonas TaxID=196821 RepID=UPI000702CA9C|nr:MULTISPECIES: DUF6543 domain-containing protein [unclassified Pseudomonas]KQM48682.1 hypothetical protein ASE80_11575 [Pseudomonas sp. Leaf15]RAH02159.1 hypothetical protein DJ480_14080 [Pseudomonas sp. Leaf98]
MPNDLLNNNHRPPSAYELLTQLTTGPTTHEVAATTLRSALKELYPTVNIDPDLAMVVSPRWHIVGDAVEPAPAVTQSLTSVLAHQALSSERVTYIDGEHFLTLQPNAAAPVHLAVKIDAIARLINELSDLLFTASQEQQLNFWNASNGSSGPRWQAFSSSLRKVWNVTEEQGLDEHQAAMARGVFQEPDRDRRSLNDRYKCHTYLVDVDLLRDGESTHVSFMDIAVLVGEHDKLPLILTHSLVNGYETFESLEAFGASLPARLSAPKRDTTLQWRLYEPEGNFFDTLACTLIELQIRAIGSYSQALVEEPAEEQASPATVARIVPSIEELSDHQLSSIREVHHQLPDWLASASDSDTAAYSRYMIDLAQLHTHYHGETFQDGIAPIRDYARTQLQSRIQSHKDGARLNLDKIEVVIESPVVWGTFVVPGSVDITRRGLIDLTLDNLTGLPTGNTTVRYNGNDNGVPSWLTFSYLKDLIEDIDIGEHYPALIKQKLLDDAEQSSLRQQLYISHLRLQLPLLALQMKIRKQGAIDERGYRYVAAVMHTDEHDRHVDGQPIVIRALAFLPTLRPGNERDVVANMFVIGPRDANAGPCLLYRPLLEPVLMQYPSRQNLLYAIKHERPLRESVLAWLPQAQSFNYAQYVFPDTLPSPWTVVRALVEPLTLLYMSGPVTLADEEVGNDALATLFKANASAMVELADRQSVSNVQKRWATFRHTGWQIFNAALPFMGRTVGIAAWIWQIMDDLQATEEAVNKGDQHASWTALVDVFLNLGMALTLHIALRHPRPLEQFEAPKIETESESTTIETAGKPPFTEKKYTAVQQANIPDSQLPVKHQGAVHILGALSHSRLGLAKTLDSFKIAKPDKLGEQNKTPGRHLNLYPLADKWYAPVGAHWFEVRVDENDSVIIIDSKAPLRTGPPLIGNLAGQWFVDIRLRLRGGGLRNRQRAVKVNQPERIAALMSQLNAFDAVAARQQLDVLESEPALDAAPGPSTDLRRTAFIGKVDNRLKAYDEAISQLKSLSNIEAVPTYQSNMSEYLKQQIQLTQVAIEQQLVGYEQALKSSSTTLNAEVDIDYKNQAKSAQNLSTLNLAIIKRLEFINDRFSDLKALGKEGAAVIHKTMSELPTLTLTELKSLEIGLGRYLCIDEEQSQIPAALREQMDQCVDTAELNVESFTEIMERGNDTSLDERIDVLNSLVEQFSSADERLLDLHAEHPQFLLKPRLQSFRQQIGEFSQIAIHDLAQLLREKKALEPKPGSSKAPRAPQRKVIKTRYDGVLIAQPRESDSTLFDVKASVTGKVLATFHEKTPGVWVKRQKVTPPPPVPATVDLDTSINTGQTLLDSAPAETRKYQGFSSKPWHTPQDIQDMFEAYAKKLEDASNDIEQALTRRNLTESDHGSAASTKRNLNDEAQRLYRLGRKTYIDMIKQQPPTAARVEWLHSQGLIRIQKTSTRSVVKGPPKGYLDEYEVRDKETNAVLWYAHFHYSKKNAALEVFDKAHLKTREQRRLGGSRQRTGRNDWEEIEIHRSSISDQLAKSLFFTPTAAMPGASVPAPVR